MTAIHPTHAIAQLGGALTDATLLLRGFLARPYTAEALLTALREALA